MEIKIPPFDRLIECYKMCLMTEGKSPKTTSWYEANLRRFSSFLKNRDCSEYVQEIGLSEAREFIFHLQNGVRRWETSPYVHDSNHLSPFSIQGYVRSIKAFWSWLVDEGYIQDNVMMKLRLPKVPRKILVTFGTEQIQRLINALDRSTARGFRDYTIILVLLDTGVRLSELVNLRVGDIDFEQSYFVVNGKGNRERVVPFGSQVRRVLWRYMSHYRHNNEGLEVKELFVSESGLPLRSRAVQSMFGRLSKRAGISGVRCSPHTFRHTFARNYLMCGGDVFSLQRILGHSSLEMVRAYVQLAAGDIAAQHRKFSPVDNMLLRRKR